MGGGGVEEVPGEVWGRWSTNWPIPLLMISLVFIAGGANWNTLHGDWKEREKNTRRKKKRDGWVGEWRDNEGWGERERKRERERVKRGCPYEWALYRTLGCVWSLYSYFKFTLALWILKTLWQVCLIYLIYFLRMSWEFLPADRTEVTFVLKLKFCCLWILHTSNYTFIH